MALHDVAGRSLAVAWIVVLLARAQASLLRQQQGHAHTLGRRDALQIALNQSRLLDSFAGASARHSVAAWAGATAAQLVQDEALQRDLSEHLQPLISMGCADAVGARPAQCAALLEAGHRFVEHQDMASQALNVYRSWVTRTSPQVQGWGVSAAVPESTDRVAVMVLLDGNQHAYFQNNFEYVVKSVMRRLGPRWALQVFYGSESQKAGLVRALGDPKNVTWTLASLQGRPLPLNREGYNQFRWSKDLFSAVHPKHEHIFFFELDSLLLRSKCVDKPNLLSYDFVGGAACTDATAECHTHLGQPVFLPRLMNGGLTLRRRPTMLQAVGAYPRDVVMSSMTRGNGDEDTVATAVFTKMGFTLAPEDVAERFSFNMIPTTAPCAFHKPWFWPSTSPAMMQAVLDSADFPAL